MNLVKTNGGWNKVLTTLLLMVLPFIGLFAQNGGITTGPTGNVGIGTQNPQTLFEVKGDNPVQLMSTTKWNGQDNGTVELRLGDHNHYIRGQFGKGMVFQDVNQFSFQGSNVGIGTSNPSALLHISGSESSTDGFSSAITLENTASGGKKWYLRAGATGTATPTGGFSIANENAYIMSFTDSNNVGIGTSTPTAPLHVKSTQNMVASSKQYGYLNQTGASVWTNTSAQVAFSIISEGRIKASEFDAVSDRRIKRIEGISLASEDLNTLNKLEVTDYNHIDYVQKGSASKKGFIAQQVEQFFPQAVSQSVGFIPNIYELSQQVHFSASDQTLTIRLEQSHTLVKGDVIQLITDQGEVQSTITNIPDNHSLILSEWKEPVDQIFIFGKQVDDFRTVDYDRIFTLGISAIQELHREIERLKVSNHKLKLQVEESQKLASQVTLIQAQLAQLTSSESGKPKTTSVAMK